jgi:hypothetical protein
LRGFILVLTAYCLAPSAIAQKAPVNRSQLEVSSVADAHDFRDTVLPLTDLRLDFGIAVTQATGFCLDAACRFIGTNYHFAARARPHKIKGEKVIQRYLATGPDDEGATVNEVISGIPLKFNLSRDLAVFELQRSLPHHHGVAFSLDEMQIGQEVDIYAYPKESISPSRQLLQFHGSFKGIMTTGLLAFDYKLSAGKMIRPGASGGIVVDGKTQRIVGILNAISENGEPIAVAVPVQSLFEFVSKVQPFLAQSLFPSNRGLSPVSADIYPKFVLSHMEGLQIRLPEPANVQLLRSKAQELADSMRNFIAVQTFVWGSGDEVPVAEAAYEVRVIDGNQRFREYPDGKKELSDAPFPNLINSIVPGGEWSDLPDRVGTKLRLKIHQAPDVVVNEKRMKVFQYLADIEDDVCRFKSSQYFMFFEVSKTYSVACYGEVWTDEDTNILRISEHLELPRDWKEYQAVVTYGWLHPEDSTSRLIPLTISSQAELGNKIYWCRGLFTNYQMFGSRIRISRN